MNDATLLDGFLKTIDAKAHNTKRLFVVAFVGVNGSGKSTIAQALAAKTGLYIASNDAIRRYLNGAGIEGAAPAQETVQFIAESTTTYLYDNQISHIIDADMLKFHQQARKRAEQFGAKFYLIHVTCEDSEIRRRIINRDTQRQQGVDNTLSHADIAEYEKRKALHDSEELPVFDAHIATDKPIEPQLSSLLEMLSDDL